MMKIKINFFLSNTANIDFNGLPQLNQTLPISLIFSIEFFVIFGITLLINHEYLIFLILF